MDLCKREVVSAPDDDWVWEPEPLAPYDRLKAGAAGAWRNRERTPASVLARCALTVAAANIVTAVSLVTEQPGDALPRMARFLSDAFGGGVIAAIVAGLIVMLDGAASEARPRRFLGAALIVIGSGAAAGGIGQLMVVVLDEHYVVNAVQWFSTVLFHLSPVILGLAVVALGLGHRTASSEAVA